MKKNLLLLSVLSLATGVLFSCKENEKESSVQLPAPVVLQDEAKSGATTVAATWTEIPNAISYSIVFDEGEPITISSTERLGLISRKNPSILSRSRLCQVTRKSILIPTGARSSY